MAWTVYLQTHHAEERGRGERREKNWKVKNLVSMVIFQRTDFFSRMRFLVYVSSRPRRYYAVNCAFALFLGK